MRDLKVQDRLKLVYNAFQEYSYILRKYPGWIVPVVLYNIKILAVWLEQLRPFVTRYINFIGYREVTLGI